MLVLDRRRLEAINIAYLHAIHKLIVIDKLKKLLWIRHKTATPTTHAIPASNNHNKHPTQQHKPRKPWRNYRECL